MKILLIIVLVWALLDVAWSIARTFLVENSVEHGMGEKEAQKRYRSVLSLLWRKHKEKKHPETAPVVEKKKTEHITRYAIDPLRRHES